MSLSGSSGFSIADFSKPEPLPRLSANVGSVVPYWPTVTSTSTLPEWTPDATGSPFTLCGETVPLTVVVTSVTSQSLPETGFVPIENSAVSSGSTFSVTVSNIWSSPSVVSSMRTAVALTVGSPPAVFLTVTDCSA